MTHILLQKIEWRQLMLSYTKSIIFNDIWYANEECYTNTALSFQGCSIIYVNPGLYEKSIIQKIFLSMAQALKLFLLWNLAIFSVVSYWLVGKQKNLWINTLETAVWHISGFKIWLIHCLNRIWSKLHIAIRHCLANKWSWSISSPENKVNFREP